MRIGACDEGICFFDFQYRHTIETIIKQTEALTNEKFEEREHPCFSILEQQMKEYFAGARQQFDLPLRLVGTDFQKSVWNALLHIPYGDTTTYKQQSVAVGNEKAIRAVAGANGENAIAIIIPCHRVIGANGSLTGYSGGLERKKWLLGHERRYTGRAGQAVLF